MINGVFISNRGENETLVGAIPFADEYPGPRFEDKFLSANQMDGISKAGGDKMAVSKFVNKRTCKTRCDIYRQKVHPVTASISVKVLGNKIRHWYL